MTARWIQNKPNGVARIEPRLAVVDATDRYLFIATVMFAALGFFSFGAMPVEVLGVVSAICFAGDFLIVLRLVFSAADQRPVAPVAELSTLRYR